MASRNGVVMDITALLAFFSVLVAITASDQSGTVLYTILKYVLPPSREIWCIDIYLSEFQTCLFCFESENVKVF